MFMINPSKLLFLMITAMGTLISVSSNTWPTAWMGLEINLMAFIPLIFHKANTFSSEASMKYFLIQAMASSLLLMTTVMMLLLTSSPFKNQDLWFQFLIMSTLFLKMGAAPFHFWFPVVMEGLSWFNCFMLMTWQKLAPFMIISYLTLVNHLTYFIIIMSIIIGSIGGLNQTSTRKIMAYSSINHIGWMLMAMSYSENLWIIYFIIYSIISLTLVLFFMNTSNLHMNHLSLKINSSPEIKLLIMVSMLSLGGLPPFLGFLPKWMIIQSSINDNNLLMMMFIMVILTLMTSFYYLRLSMSSFLLNNSQVKWNHQSNLNFSSTPYMLTIFTSFSLLGLTFYPLILYSF